MTVGDVRKPAPQRDAAALGGDVHDATVDAEVELVARLVAAAASTSQPLTDDELDDVLLH